MLTRSRWFPLILAWAMTCSEPLRAETPQQNLYAGAAAIQQAELIPVLLRRVNPDALQNVRFAEVIARVEEITGLQVRVDWLSLSDAGIDIQEDTLIPEWPAQEPIDQLLKRLPVPDTTELTWVVEDRLITLKTRDDSQLPYTTERYFVGDLLPKDRQTQPLSDLISSMTSGPWDSEEPGTGTILAFGNHLFLRQTAKVQLEVREVLVALRSQAPIVLFCSEEELRLRRLLDSQLVTFDWPEITLKEFAQRLGEMTEAKFRIDEYLADTGIPPDTKLRARAKGLSLRVALEVNLSNVEDTALTVVIVDDAFLICEIGCDRYSTIIHQVDDLMRSPDHRDQLIELIEAETSGPWDREEPGTGSITVLPESNRLLIRQTERVQLEILKLLRDLRSLPKDEPLFTDEAQAGPILNTR